MTLPLADFFLFFFEEWPDDRYPLPAGKLTCRLLDWAGHGECCPWVTNLPSERLERIESRLENPTVRPVVFGHVVLGPLCAMSRGFLQSNKV